jgi:MFS family permease
LVLPCRQFRSGESTSGSNVNQRLNILRYLVGPPVGGSLYKKFGFRGPFIFGIVAALFDLAGRLLVIERGTALKWGADPKEPQSPESVQCLAQTPTSSNSPNADGAKEVDVAASASPTKTLSLVAVVIRLSRSQRALAALLITLIYG